jgi:hypothetical protein
MGIGFHRLLKLCTISFKKNSIRKKKITRGKKGNNKQAKFWDRNVIIQLSTLQKLSA